jgi:3-methyladenine DNA glycosylase AlkC
VFIAIIRYHDSWNHANQLVSTSQNTEQANRTERYSSYHPNYGCDARSSQSSNTSSIPPRAEVIDRWQRHTNLQQFGRALQDAAKSIYPNRNRSRYKNVYVLILKWETEDPKLPVSYEIEELRQVLDEIYHYHIDIFEIPDKRSHAKVSEKINSFVEINDDSKDDLKIVYYAGHSRSSKTRDLIWSRCVVYICHSN